MSKRLSPAAVIALKEALCQIYWYKTDLKSFVFQCVSNKPLLASINWSALKRQISSDVVDGLIASGERGLSDLTHLCVCVAEMDTFTHLERLEDGAAKAKQAKIAVEQLRTIVEPSQRKTESARAGDQRQQAEKKKVSATVAVQEKLRELLDRYRKLVVASHDPQARGYELERLMYEVFRLFDLDPKASFKSAGEQVDGGFSLDGSDYLFEGKWTASQVPLRNLSTTLRQRRTGISDSSPPSWAGRWAC